MIGGVVAIVVYSVAIPLSQLTLGGPEFSVVFQIGAVLVPLRIWGKIASNYFRSEMQVKFFSGIKTARAYLSILGVLVVIFLFDYGISGVIGVVVGAELLYVIFLQIIITSRLGIAHPSFNGFMQYIRYSVPLMTSIIASKVSSRVDRILIGFFLGPTAVGLYSISYQLTTSITFLQNPITTTFFPEFSRLIEENRISECLEYQRQGVRYYTGLGIPAIGGLYLIGPEIAEILATTATARPSALLISALSIGMFLSGLDRVYAVLLVASERTGILTIIRGFGATANVVLNILLIPEFGIIGAAATTATTYALTYGLIYYKSREIFSISSDYLFFLKTALSSVIMILLTNQFGIGNIIVILFFAPICYFITLRIFNGYKFSEIGILLKET
jgi:O-antigen/teichoic acid export membrane protein